MNKDTGNFENELLQLARLALTGRDQDIQLLIHRISRKMRHTNPSVATALTELLHESPTRSSPLRKQTDHPLPVDVDSRLNLIRIEKNELEHEPIYTENIAKIFSQIIAERHNLTMLTKHGLYPTKSILLNGPPGVGKTMAARWLSQKLNRPLMILDLAAVMSSYLGRTGNNIRFVLDYAKNTECILLLDEFDAIAKRRDDNSEVGELKRLVTVLLQEIDDWPSSGLLIAATNHPDLLDPAIWRRFEVVVNFENPTEIQIQQILDSLLKGYIENIKVWSKVLSYFFIGQSFSEVERQILFFRKQSALQNIPLEDYLKALLIKSNQLTREKRIELANTLTINKIVSARQATVLTGVSRDTIRNRQKEHKKK